MSDGKRKLYLFEHTNSAAALVLVTVGEGEDKKQKTITFAGGYDRRDEGFMPGYVVIDDEATAKAMIATAKRLGKKSDYVFAGDRPEGESIRSLRTKPATPETVQEKNKEIEELKAKLAKFESEEAAKNAEKKTPERNETPSNAEWGFKGEKARADSVNSVQAASSYLQQFYGAQSSKVATGDAIEAYMNDELKIALSDLFPNWERKKK